MTDLLNPIFQDAAKARKHLEAILWPDGPVCPHCGVIGEATLLKGKSTRPGVYKCRPCQKPFSVTVGTVFERSKVPLNKWLLATHLLCSSKKGISAHLLHRSIGVTYKTAWFMMHRIRESIREENPTPLGGEGIIVEADETYHGHTDEGPKYEFVTGKGWTHKRNNRPVVTLVERGGRVRSFHVGSGDAYTAREILVTNVRRESKLMTDESPIYTRVGQEYASHETVKHSAKEYVRGTVYTNTIESFFSIFKHGMRGIYQHCGESHLHRYLAEFDFRHNNRTALKVSDRERTDNALLGIVGKRLTYRRIDEAAYS